MANLPETAQWEAGVYQLETTDPVQGGPDGIDNQQAKQLANRTAYLKQLIEGLDAGTYSIAEVDAAIAALVAVDEDLQSQINTKTDQATETANGTAELATTAEAQAGTDDLRIMTPKKTHEALGRFGVAGDVSNYLSLTSMERQVSAASGGNLRLIHDDLDNPSYMYRVPKVNLEDIGLPGTSVHPAFIVNGVEIPEFWVGAYQAQVINGRACSLPGVDPTTSIDFDAAMAACNAKGAGWHLSSNVEWSAIQGICRSMGHIPRGNTNYGRAYEAVYETGRRVDNLPPGTESGTGRTHTGSGPASWNHNGQEFGIADLVGNVWEWQSGLRLVDGEIQIIKDNDAAAQADHSDLSAAWKAILQTGSLAAPGTSGTLKLDGTSANNATAAQINTVLTNITGDTNYNYTNFESLAAATGVTIPDLLKVLGMAPYTTHDSDKLWSRNSGERLPFRGGYWIYGADAGLSALYLLYFRSNASSSVGFRPAFCEL